MADISKYIKIFEEYLKKHITYFSGQSCLFGYAIEGDVKSHFLKLKLQIIRQLTSPRSIDWTCLPPGKYTIRYTLKPTPYVAPLTPSISYVEISSGSSFTEHTIDCSAVERSRTVTLYFNKPVILYTLSGEAEIIPVGENLVSEIRRYRKQIMQELKQESKTNKLNIKTTSGCIKFFEEYFKKHSKLTGICPIPSTVKPNVAPLFKNYPVLFGVTMKGDVKSHFLKLHLNNQWKGWNYACKPYEVDWTCLPPGRYKVSYTLRMYTGPNRPPCAYIKYTEIPSGETHLIQFVSNFVHINTTTIDLKNPAILYVLSGEAQITPLNPKYNPVNHKQHIYYHHATSTPIPSPSLTHTAETTPEPHTRYPATSNTVLPTPSSTLTPITSIILPLLMFVLVNAVLYLLTTLFKK